MNFKKVSEIIKFNIQKSVQNKWFIILNIIMFIIILLSTNWSNISNYLQENNINVFSSKDITLQILDTENIFYNSFAEKHNDTYNIEKVEENPYSSENLPSDETILIEVKSDPEKIITATIYSKEAFDSSLGTIIEEALIETRSILFASYHGISIESFNTLNEEVSIEVQYLGVDAENSDTKEMIKIVSVVLIYVILIFVLSRIANEIAQEKVSKSIEYVLTSVTASEYLLAKVLSVTLSILVQVLYIFVYYMIGININTLFALQSLDLSNLSLSAITEVTTSTAIDISIINYIIVMAIYLIFTVFITALIQATLTSKTNSVSEAGNTTMLLCILIIALYFISLTTISPYITVTPFMYIISCLPIVSTFFVPAMMIIGQATTLQIIISFVVLIVSLPFIFKYCSKHFKNGILDYSTSKKNKKVKKELSLKEKQNKDLKISIARRFAFTIGLSLILWVFLQSIFGFILPLILPSFINLDTETLNIISTGLTLLISLIIPTLYIMSNIKEKENPKKLSIKQNIGIIFIGIALLSLIQLGIAWLYTAIGLDYNVLEEAQFTTSGSLLSNILYILVLACIPAIFEELLFRKAILNYSKQYGKVFAIIFSSLIFALFHMNLYQGIFAFLMGVVFSTIAIRTSSIKIPILIHFLNNLFAAVQTILPESTLLIINIAVVVIFIISLIVLIINLPKLRHLKKEDFKINKDFLYIFRNYTFIISIILTIVMFILTEKLLTM